MPQFQAPSSGWNNPQMNRQGRSGQTPVPNTSGVGYWNDLLAQGFGQQPTQINAQQFSTPNMSNDWKKYLSGMTSPFQKVQAQNVNAPQMSGDWQKYLQAGTQNINAGSMQDTSALIRSYDPLLQRQQEQGFDVAAAWAGKTGMWGSPYAGALGREAASASAQRANIANQYLYQASEAQANR